jgi:glycine betaine/proline transport system substrate-binding protein
MSAMRSAGMRGAFAVVLGFTLTASACSPSVTPEGSGRSPSPRIPTSAASAVAGSPGIPGSCGTVTLALHPWVGYEADAAVVGYLLQHELGCSVVKRQLDDESSWQFLASGGVDVILENWDHEDLAAKLIAKDKVAQDAGPNGNEGVIGWYVPRFFADANADILTAATNPSILNKYADQLGTAASGGKGQLLDGEPGFVTQDKAMIAGFGLNYQVVYAGSDEAAHEAIRTAVDQRRPILAYYVEPNWFSTKVDLVHVPLPPFTPGCNKDPARIACDYPIYHLNKVVSTRFAESGSPAYELVKKFTWTNADQDAVAALIADGHLADDAAAKQWLDANPAKWRAWMP